MFGVIYCILLVQYLFWESTLSQTILAACAEHSNRTIVLVKGAGEEISFNFSICEADQNSLQLAAYTFCTLHGLIKLLPNCPLLIFSHVQSEFSTAGVAIHETFTITQLQQIVHTTLPVGFNTTDQILHGVVNRYSKEALREWIEQSEFRISTSTERFRHSLGVSGRKKMSRSDWNFDIHFQEVLAKIRFLGTADIGSSSFEWVDEKLCIHIMTNVKLINLNIPIPIPPEYFGAAYGFHEEWRSIRCTGSLQWNTQWSPSYWLKPWDWQHIPILGLDSDAKFPKDRPISMCISIYDVFALKNIAHTVDSVELFWSVMAAAQDSKAVKATMQCVAFFSLFSKSNINFQVTPFVSLLYQSIYHYCVENRISVLVESIASFKKLLFQTTEVMIDDSILIEIGLSDLIPVLLERPLHNVLTPSGALLLQSATWLQCALSQVGSQQSFQLSSIRSEKIQYSSVDLYVEASLRQIQRTKTRLVVLCYRTTARHIVNLDEIYGLLVDYFERMQGDFETRNEIQMPFKYLVTAVNFGSLTPCDQIAIASQAKWFIFVHGAEGGLISFLQPNAVVVEMHPAGCCVPDFDDENYAKYYEADAYAVGAQYYFFDGTLASSWICDDWLTKIMVSPICGTYILPTKFIEAIDGIYDAVKEESLG